ncbi:MAG: RICIN domain-containing protein [Atopobiaceae bacterium]|nr:RICIN domain-containing protein [Atopobiaceae bacterium]
MTLPSTAEADADTLAASSATATTASSPSGAALTVQSAEEATGIPASGEGTDYVAGEVLVTFRDGTTRAEATQAVQGAAAVSTGQVTEGDLVATSVEGDTLVSDTEGVAPDASAPMAKVGVADGSTVVQAVAELEQDPIVESAQPNYLYHAMDDEVGDASTLAETVAEESGTAVATQSTASINDPYFTNSSLWQLSGTYGVDAATAWNTTKCDGNVSVAIIDTGCLATHEDLAANIKDTYISPSADRTVTDGHGTHVAGLVSAVSNNGVGVSGVSYNAGLVICKADNNGSFDTKSLVEAYVHVTSVAKTYNVKVVNMSLGGPGGCPSDDALLAKVDAAYAAGIVTVCAAGNAGTYNNRYYSVPYAEYPGDYATCVSVINTMSDGTRSLSSNYNSSGSTSKNIAAPGTSLQSTWDSRFRPYTSYKTDSGTSMASPVVAGIVALEFAEDPDLTPDQAKGVLYGTTTDLGDSGWDKIYGYGLASASGAVDAIIGANDVKLSGTSFAYTGSAVTPSVTVTTASGKTLTKGTDYTVSYSNNVSVGTATVTVAGKGSYSCSGNTASGSGYIGTVSKTFKIAVSVPYCADVLGAGSGAAYTIRTKRAADRLVDISGRSLANGGNAQMYHGNETPAQRFYVSFAGVSGGKGYYTVRNVCSGKVLDVAGGSSRAGANVQQYSGNGTKAQQWVAAPSPSDSSYFVLTNVGSGLVLDIAGNSSANGANLQQWGANGTSAQDFCFTRCDSSGVSTGTSHAFAIHNVKNSERVVDVCGNSPADQANIWLYDANGTAAQKFWFSYDAKNGYYTIHNKGNGKVVDVAGAAQDNGSNIWQYQSNGTDAQHWSIKRNSNGSYTLYCACNGRCFDVDGGLTTNGRNIWCWDANGTTAQQWTLEAA